MELYCENCGLIEFFSKQPDGSDFSPVPQRCDEVLVITDAGVDQETWCDLCTLGCARRGVTELNGRKTLGTRAQRGANPVRVRFLDEDLGEGDE